MKSSIERTKSNIAPPMESEENLRKWVANQTLAHLMKKSSCFNLLAVGEEGLGKITFLETLFKMPASGLREARKKAPTSNDNPLRDMQIITEKIVTPLSSDSGTASSNKPKLTIRLMSTVAYSITEPTRQPWNTLANHIGNMINDFMNARSDMKRTWNPEDDNRIHCCLYFIPPTGGPGLRRCDLLALKTLEDRVNLIPVLAKADCYTTEELRERKEAIAADIERNGLSIHQYLDSKENLMMRPMAVIGARYPETTRSLPWGIIDVEDDQCSDMAMLRTLLLERNMLILRKSTKRLHTNTIKQMKASTLPRK